LVALFRHFRLAQEPNSPGLSCGPDGPRLAGVGLLRRTTAGFSPRPADELAALTLAAFGQVTDIDRLSRGLAATADALNAGDVGKAMIAALHLRLPDVSRSGAARVSAVDDYLAKYDPDQPRDWRGRWTTDGGADRPPTAAPSPSASSAPRTRSPDDWGVPSHPTGGRLILTGGAEDDAGENEPPPSEGTVVPEYPEFPSQRVPVGYDDPDGVRRPKFADGQLRPVATRISIRMTLQARKDLPGGPRMVLFVPIDGKGPALLGSTPQEDIPPPPSGYSEVYLEGLPQETKRDGAVTNHGLDGAERALELALTNRYDLISFNRSLARSTNREVESYLRPDVLARVRPELDLGYRYVPQESLSPRQTIEDRQSQMPQHPSLLPVTGDHYKLLKALLARRLRKLLAMLRKR